MDIRKKKITESTSIPKISIIVPVYNVEDYLKRCIDSILCQTYLCFELILVNDGSEDYSGKICDSYVELDDRIRVIHKDNGGLSSARNIGIEEARGMYVVFVDSDDWISQDAIQYLLETIERTNSDIVSATYQLTDGECKEIDVQYTENLMTRDQAVKNYLLSGMKHRIADYSFCAKIYKRKLFDTVRFPVGQIYEDGATNLEIILSVNRYVKSNKVVYYYFQGRNSIVNSKFRKKTHNDLILFGKKCIDLLKNESVDIQLLAEQKLARTYLSSMLRIIMYGIDKTEEDWKEIVDDIEKGLRKNYFLLMRSPMPLNRKIIMSILVINYKIPMFIISILKKRFS